jgi:hypothetical protein
MQNKVRYFQLGMVTLLIITCLVIFPGAAAAPFHIPDSTRFTGYKLSDSSRSTDFISHAVASYHANPARFASNYSTTLLVPSSTFDVLDGSSATGISSPDWLPASDYTPFSNNWDDLFPAPIPPGGSCGG